MAAETQHYCMTVDCNVEAIKYCRNCDQLFCAEHDQPHEQFMKRLVKPHAVLTIDEYIMEREENSPFCSQHPQSPLMAACVKCYRPMCGKCLDETTDQATNCQPDGQDKHTTRSIELVSQKLQDELQQLLSEFRVKELTIGDELKKTQQFYDKLMDNNRGDLEKLSAKVDELHKQIDETAAEIRDEVVSHMEKNKQTMQKLEADYSEYQKSCRQVHEKTTRFVCLKNEAIVRDHQKVRGDIEALMTFKFEENLKLSEMSVKFDDGPLQLPICLAEVSQPLDGFKIPKSLTFREEQEADNTIRSVLYLRDSRLVYGGYGGLRGLSFTPEFGGGRIYSLVEHGECLYVLDAHADEFTYHIHKINLKSQSVQKSVITCSYNRSYQQIAVNDDYIIVSNCPEMAIKVYSSKEFTHLFNIQHKSFREDPWGVAFLNATLVVGDWNKSTVSNITLSAKPELKWTYTDIKRPSAIRVCSQVKLVGSWTQQIHVLSHEGKRLSVLDLSQCSEDIVDIAVFDNKLAVADKTSTVKIYDIEEE